MNGCVKNKSQYRKEIPTGPYQRVVAAQPGVGVVHCLNLDLYKLISEPIKLSSALHTPSVMFIGSLTLFARRCLSTLTVDCEEFQGLGRFESPEHSMFLLTQ